MRHLKAGRKLGVDPSHRKALMRSMTLALIEHESIRTTPARAKELRRFADRVVTLAKRGDLHSRRRIVQMLGSTQTKNTGNNRVRNALERIYTRLVPRFQGRNGGYTQIIRLANRRLGDNAELCVMRYLPAEEEAKAKSAGAGAKKKAKKKTAAAAPKKKAAGAASKTAKKKKTSRTAKKTAAKDK